MKLAGPDRAAGFTLVETLAATAIAAVLIAALASLLTGAFKVVRVLDVRSDGALEHSLIALEKTARELQESPVYPSIPFEGRRNGFSFPVMAGTERRPSPFDTEFRLGQIQETGPTSSMEKAEYYYDTSKRAWMRKSGSGPAVVLAAPIDGVSISYAITSLDGGPVSWADQAPAGTGMSVEAVRIAFHLARGGRRSVPAVERTMLLARRHPMILLQEDEARMGLS